MLHVLESNLQHNSYFHYCMANHFEKLLHSKQMSCMLSVTEALTISCINIHYNNFIN